MSHAGNPTPKSTTSNMQLKMNAGAPFRQSQKLQLVLGALLVVFMLKSNGSRRKTVLRPESVFALSPPPTKVGKETLFDMGPPDFTSLQTRIDAGQNRTLFILPGRDLDCSWQYNYVCKFFFAVRCYMLAGFSRVVVLTSLPEVQGRVRPGDVLLLPYRSYKHKETPELLQQLNEWRHAANAPSNAQNLRIGVFHIANENSATTGRGTQKLTLCCAITGCGM